MSSYIFKADTAEVKNKHMAEVRSGLCDGIYRSPDASASVGGSVHFAAVYRISRMAGICDSGAQGSRSRRARGIYNKAPLT